MPRKRAGAKASPTGSRPITRSRRQASASDSQADSEPLPTPPLPQRKRRQRADTDHGTAETSHTTKSKKPKNAPATKKATPNENASIPMNVDDSKKNAIMTPMQESHGHEPILPENAMYVQHDNAIEASSSETKHHESKENKVEEEDDEDDDIDQEEWEAIDIPSYTHTHDTDAHDDIVSSPPEYKDVEIVFTPEKPATKKNNLELMIERQRREWIHNCHVLLLITHFTVRNKWCCLDEIKHVCKSAVPEHIQKQCKRKDVSEEAFDTGIKWLLAWWGDYFRVTRPGFMTRAYQEYQCLQGNETPEMRAEIMDQHGLYTVDRVPTRRALVDKLVERAASADVAVELIVAMLRSLGFTTRLIASLQPIPYRIPSSERQSSSRPSSPAPDSDTKTDISFPFRTPRPHLYPSTSDTNPSVATPISASPPTLWAEVYSPHKGRWVCVDPIRGLYDRPRQMEPMKTDRRHIVSFILAFEDDLDGVTDVTRRYTTRLAQALKLRERALTPREKESGMQSWVTVLLRKIARRKVTERDEKEQRELQDLEASEQMPTSIQEFNNHPLYALERHLKKFEILHPKTPVLGHIKGEAVYPRSCVKKIHTADTWIKLGRVIREGEPSVKQVVPRATTLERKRQLAAAVQDGQPLMTNCYGDWQTEVYRPPPVINGIVPRNPYGNVNLFTPEMLPHGAVHLPIQGMGRLARKLEIDAADAVVGFDFVSGKSVPVIQGVVVPTDAEHILREAWQEQEQIEIEKMIEKKKKEQQRQERLQVQSERIHEHVESAYGGQDDDDDDDGGHSMSSQHDAHNKTNPDDDGGGGGGYLLPSP